MKKNIQTKAIPAQLNVEAATKPEKSEKKLKSVLIAECGVVVILIIILCVRAIARNSSTAGVNNSEVVEETTIDGAQALADSDTNLSASYTNLIVGNFTSDNGHQYTFSSDNTFTGYINEENPAATGTFLVVTDGSATTLTITAGNVQKNYGLKFTSDGSIELTDKDTGEKAVLE